MELSEIFEKQIEVEKENAAGLKSVAEKVENPLIREIFVSISFDSRKHAGLYKAITEFLSGFRKPLSKEEFRLIGEAVEKHIKVEEKMINFIEKVLSEERVDANIAYILEYILQDERRHHALMRGILEAIAKKEIAEFDDWWNIVWKIYGERF